MGGTDRPRPVVAASAIAVTVARANGGTAVVAATLIPSISGHRRLCAAAIRCGYCTTVTATMMKSAANSANPANGTTMPHRRRAVKNEMAITARATTGAP